MSDAQLPSEEKRPDSIVGLWNDKNRLASQLDALIEPFLQKYQLRADQVEISFSHVGAFIKVKF